MHNESMTFDYDQTAQLLIKWVPELGLHIAKACEQAYRRGYQQGYEHGINREPEELIWQWRFSYPYELAIAPPDKRGVGYGYSCTSINRLQMEAGNSSPLIYAIAKLTKDPDDPDDCYNFGMLPVELINKYKPAN